MPEPTRFTARPVSDRRCRLAEGPVWDAGRQRVLWVDIRAGQVFEGRFDNGFLTTTGCHDFPGTVGAVVSAADGRLLVAGGNDLAVIEPNGRRQQWGDQLIPAGVAGSPLTTSSQATRRLNDGGCDQAGRFLVGSLALGDQPAPGQECLWRMEFDGSATLLDSDLSLSNGLAWSADGRWFYSIDTGPGLVWVRPYEPVSGRVGHREQLLHITDGFPDGMCLDVDGNLWIAIWGAGEVRCYSPGGEVLAVVQVDAPHTTSVAFIGRELDTLLITTGSNDEESPDHTAELGPDDSGRVFAAAVGTRGVPTTPWRGDAGEGRGAR